MKTVFVGGRFLGDGFSRGLLDLGDGFGCGLFDLGDGFGRGFFDLGHRRLRPRRFASPLVRRLLGAVARPERVLATAREVGLEVVRPDEVLDVEERGALETDVDERGLQTRQDPGDPAEVDVAGRAAAGLCAPSLDVELGDDAVLDERDARLGDVARNDEDILGHTEQSFPARTNTLLAGHA